MLSMGKVALGPLFIVWFSYGIFPNILIAFSICFFPILLISGLIGPVLLKKQLLDRCPVLARLTR